MNPITDEQFQKITLIDKLFGSISVEQLREITESEQIVSRLKGTENNPQILLSLIRERDILTMKVIAVESELAGIKADFQSLLRVLHVDVFTPRYNQDFQNLKSKHNVY